MVPNIDCPKIQIICLEQRGQNGNGGHLTIHAMKTTIFGMEMHILVCHKTFLHLCFFFVCFFVFAFKFVKLWQQKCFFVNCYEFQTTKMKNTRKIKNKQKSKWWSQCANQRPL